MSSEDKEPTLPPPQHQDWASGQHGKCGSHTSSIRTKQSRKAWCSAHKPQVIIHQGANSKDVILVHTGPNNLQANLIILLNHNVLIHCLVTWWVGIRIKFHL